MKIVTHDMKLFHSIFAYNCVVKEQAYWEAIYKAWHLLPVTLSVVVVLCPVPTLLVAEHV